MPAGPRPLRPRSLSPLASLALGLVVAVVTARPAAGQEARWHAPGDDGWLVAAGVFDTAGSRHDAELTVAYTLPLRLFPERWYELRTETGITVTDEGGGWLWGSFLWPNELGERWTLTPFTGATVYERGDGKELGGVVEFRSGIELAYRLGEGHLGVAFYHLSNADLYDSNPGANSLVVTLRW